MNLRGWLTAAATVVGLALVAGAILLLTKEEDPEPVTGEVVTDYVSSPELHVPGELEWAETPPMGGEHNDEWLACGTYDQPVREEYAVHAIEHGAMWITHDPALSDADLATVEEQVTDNVIISPYEGLPAPIVLTVWNHQLRLTDPEDPRLAEFVENYSDGKTASEWQLQCQGGVEAYED